MYIIILVGSLIHSVNSGELYTHRHVAMDPHISFPHESKAPLITVLMSHSQYHSLLRIIICDYACINQPLGAKVKFPERKEIANTFTIIPYIFNTL